jgi:hypothetical protein
MGERTVHSTSARLLLAIIAVGALVACGNGSPSATPLGTTTTGTTPAAASSSASAQGAADGEAADLAQQAVARLTKASSVRIRGTVTDASEQITIDETAVPGKGCQGKVAIKGKGSFQITIIGTSNWMKLDRAFWTAQGLKDATALAALDGKWIKLSPKSDLAALAQLCTLQALLGKEMSPGSLQLSKGATTTINGKQVVELKDAGGEGNLFVSVASPRELLRLTSGTEAGALDFSNYNAKVKLTPPPAAQTIDGKKFGI